MAAWKNRRNPGQPNFLQGRRSNRCRRETEAKTSKDIPAALHRDVIYSQSAFLNDKGSLGRLTKAHTVGRHIRTVCGVRSPLVYNNAAGSEPGPPLAPCVTGCHHWNPALIYIALGPRQESSSLPATADPSRIKYAPVISLCPDATT